MKIAEQAQDRINAHARAVARLHEASTTGVTIAGISSTHADLIYFITPERLAALASAARGELRRLFPSGNAAGLAETIVDRARNGRGGFVVTEWLDGPASFAELLGEPDRAQVGGAMPHAAWALLEIGAPTIMALRDRSDTQLNVLDPRIGIVTDGAIGTVAECPRSGLPGAPPHVVLEFIAGTEAGDVRVPRSTRLVLGFGRFGIETDDAFLEWAIEDRVATVLVSGLTFAHPNAPDFAWIAEATARLRTAGAHVYHELTEFPSDDHLELALRAVSANSLGLSLSELPGSGDPVARAVQLGIRAGVERVVVHADDWSMSVHRTPDHEREVEALQGGNALAAARAAAGRPPAMLDLPARATFSDDIPRTGALADGWYVVVEPSPYLSDPAATIGLGDTFTGGFLLTFSAARSSHPRVTPDLDS